MGYNLWIISGLITTKVYWGKCLRPQTHMASTSPEYSLMTSLTLRYKPHVLIQPSWPDLIWARPTSHTQTPFSLLFIYHPSTSTGVHSSPGTGLAPSFQPLGLCPCWSCFLEISSPFTELKASCHSDLSLYIHVITSSEWPTLDHPYSSHPQL